jgi:hypothetical protein
MDQRAALPLLPMMANHQKQNMRDHLLAVQQIVAALASDDFVQVARERQDQGPEGARRDARSVHLMPRHVEGRGQAFLRPASRHFLAKIWARRAPKFREANS